MGEIHGIKRMTIMELAESAGRMPDTLQRKAKDLLPPPSGGRWSIHSVVTEEEGRILLGDRPAEVPARAGRKKAARTEIVAAENPMQVVAPAPTETTSWPTFHTIRRFIISSLLFAVVVVHGALIWYDCATLWDIPGQIGGGAVFIIVLAAILLASDSTLPRSSGYAMTFIFFVDCAAWKVHYEVFKTPVVENMITGFLCAFICAASFVALWVFRDTKLD